MWNVSILPVYEIRAGVELSRKEAGASVCFGTSLSPVLTGWKMQSVKQFLFLSTFEDLGLFI